jgi:hypothetical protein
MPAAIMYRQIACDVFGDVRAAASRGEQDAARALDALGWCRRADVDAARAARESASVADFLAAHALLCPPRCMCRCGALSSSLWGARRMRQRLITR